MHQYCAQTVSYLSVLEMSGLSALGAHRHLHSHSLQGNVSAFIERKASLLNIRISGYSPHPPRVCPRAEWEGEGRRPSGSHPLSLTPTVAKVPIPSSRWCDPALFTPSGVVVLLDLWN
ncbi:hypothetical protein JAAARDRAFT_542204 [Jaapia argillacea MUCL 33604]|uniref:Uncharacterized protein n=1 Tax=Jaapia argillacea MUCL 33604 TaxID=933084 RepID=A0A067PJ78_9AGAM|nr:hypothetical protein JAAARDRAFT_542204 [Jaapia argillacea MUCL 33604]